MNMIYVNSQFFMNQNIKKVVLTIAALGVLVFGGMFFSKNFTSTSDGSITVELVELDGTKRVKEIEFNTGDILLTLLEENYDNVVVENGMLMSIDTFTTASDWSTFISIDVNGEMSMVGLNEIEYEDGMIISLKLTEFIYE